MGFFGKKKTEEAAPEKNEEVRLKEEMTGEVEKLQSEFREKSTELDNITQKIEAVKKEYDETVSSIMSVKKEFNQKKMELDIVQREYKETVERNKKAASVKDEKSIIEFNKDKEAHLKIKQEVSKLSDEHEEMKKEHEEVKKELEQEKSHMHRIRKQQIEVEKELDEANARLYNAKEELEKRDQFEDTNVLTPSEKEFIAGETGESKNQSGIIEAASAVVGSLKSKLNMTIKELETVQGLLEKEREEHEEVKKELEKMKKVTKSTNKS